MTDKTCTRPEISKNTLPSGFMLAEGYDLTRLTEMFNDAKSVGPPTPGSSDEKNMANMLLETVAIKHMGMGHGITAYFDNLLGQFVVFHEGGSNGYDRLCNDDVRVEYMSHKTVETRLQYMHQRVSSGAHPTLANDVFKYVTEPYNDPIHGELWGRYIINPSELDSKFSLDSRRLKLLFRIYDLEEDPAKATSDDELKNTKATLASLEAQLKIEKSAALAASD